MLFDSSQALTRKSFFILGALVCCGIFLVFTATTRNAYASSKDEIHITSTTEPSNFNAQPNEKTPITGMQSSKKSNNASPKLVCENGGVLKEGGCECPVGWTGPTCAENAAYRGGAWSPDFHNKHFFHDKSLVPTALKIINKKVDSVLDVGCGLGVYLKDMNERGVGKCVGVEPASMKSSTLSPFSTGQCKQYEVDAFDPSKAVFEIGEQFDLVLSFEVAEHIPRNRHDRYFDFITKHAKEFIIFSGATVGQGGDGHISERPWSEWKEEFNKRGFEFLEEETTELRKGAQSWWLKKNLAFFRRVSGSPLEQTTSAQTSAPTSAPTSPSTAPSIEGCKNGGLFKEGKCQCPVGWTGTLCEQNAANDGGAWSPDFHTTNYHFDQYLVPAALKIIKGRQPNIDSVLDVGCGLGLYLKDMNEKGVKKCVGVEPASMKASPLSPFSTGQCKQYEVDAFDPSKPAFDIGEKFDLVTSFEVAEHVPRDRHDRFFDFLVNHAKDIILFSGAVTYQGGVGHIAERPWLEWKGEFEKRGFEFLQQESEELRRSVDKWWFKQNLAFFSRTNGVPPVKSVGLAIQCQNGGVLQGGKCECPVGWSGSLCEQNAAKDGGAWSPDFHTTNYHFDEYLVPAVLKIAQKYEQVNSVLDVGCGLGLYLKDMNDKGVKKCVGVEPASMKASPLSPFSTGQCKQYEVDAFDPSKPAFDIGEKFDLVTTLEVAEHIPRDRHDRFFDFLTNHAKNMILFSGAVTYQGGDGHIAERPWSEWKEELEKRGFEFLLQESKELRQSVDKWWFKQNLAFFLRKKSSSLDQLVSKQSPQESAQSSSLECQNGGQLKDGKCECPVGWSGSLCEQNSAKSGGAWSPDFHTTNYHFDPNLVPQVLKITRKFLKVNSVLDVGCGLGLYLKDMNDKGVKECVGVEPASMKKSPLSPFSTGQCQQHEVDAFDPSKPALDLGTKYDLVMSLEVVEHVPRERHDLFFDFLTRHAKKLVLFSGATLGQGGEGHIAERPWEEWKAEFEKRGFEYLEDESLKLRQVVDKWWFRQNLALFVKIE